MPLRQIGWICPACWVILIYPGTVLAEVSDKEPTPDLVWSVGLAAALLCLVTARVKPWLGAIAFALAAFWFIRLFLEIHSPDIGPPLLHEQGSGYYLQAYGAFAVTICGLALGLAWHRRKDP